MSDEQFLARWSRRKQEAKADHAGPTLEHVVEAHAPTDAAPAVPALPEPDISTLPPVESIDAATDVTAFLRKGIPQELSRAALRRAWSADPAIRDFVGLAENAWDFNDPNAMAGFGPLDYSAEQVGALVRRIVGGVVEAAESPAKLAAEAREEGARSVHVQPDLGRTSNPVTITSPQQPGEPAPELPLSSAAPQPVASGEQPVASGEKTSVAHRTHGGALPR